MTRNKKYIESHRIHNNKHERVKNAIINLYEVQKDLLSLEHNDNHDVADFINKIQHDVKDITNQLCVYKYGLFALIELLNVKLKNQNE